jgi:hypothetical protein
LFEKYDESINTHSKGGKVILYLKKDGVVKQMVIKVLCASITDVQTSMFKMTMISSTKVALGPFNIINPLIKM